MGSTETRRPDRRDQTWFEHLFRDHHRAVLAYARRRVGDCDAEDVVAEVFAIAWRKREEVPVRPLPWLYAVAGREVLHVHRSVRRRSALDDRLAREAALPLVDEFAAVDTRLSVEAPLRLALDRLSDADAEILRLWAWEQLEPARIAEVLGISAVATRVRLHRARRRLEAHLRTPATMAADARSPATVTSSSPGVPSGVQSGIGSSIHSGIQGGTP